jgi:hypothetical protein
MCTFITSQQRYDSPSASLPKSETVDDIDGLADAARVGACQSRLLWFALPLAARRHPPMGRR